MFNKHSGQEGIEFILVTVLVFFAGLFTVMVLGSKLSGFFTTDSSIIKTSKATTTTISTSSQPKYTPDYVTVDNSKPIINSPVIDFSYEGDFGSITANEDGTLNITLSNGTTIKGLTSEFYDSFNNTVSEATGSSGTNLFMHTVNSMVSDYIEANPGTTDVEIDISFGNGAWQSSTDPKWSGTGGSNFYLVKVADQLNIIYKEEGQNSNDLGYLYFPGKIDNNGNYIVDKYYQDINPNNPSNSLNNKSLVGKFEANFSPDGKSLSGTYTDIYSWQRDTGSFNFSIDNNFSVTAK